MAAGEERVVLHHARSRTKAGKRLDCGNAQDAP